MNFQNLPAFPKDEVRYSFYPRRRLNFLITLILFTLSYFAIPWLNIHFQNIALWPLPKGHPLIYIIWVAYLIIWLWICALQVALWLPGMTWVKVTDNWLYYKWAYTFNKIRFIPLNIIESFYITKGEKRNPPSIGIKYKESLNSKTNDYADRLPRMGNIMNMVNKLNSITGKSSYVYEWKRISFKKSFKFLPILGLLIDFIMDFML